MAVSIAVLGMAFSACRQAEDPQELQPNGVDLIALSTQIGGVPEVSRSGAASKAVNPMRSKTTFIDGDRMGLFLSLSSGKLLMNGNTHAKFTYDNLLYTRAGGTFTTGVGSPAGTIYYPYRTTKIDLWGIYPYDANATSYTADAYPWSVAVDQTSDAAVIGSDFLSAVSRQVVPNNTGATVDLNFKHQMTLLRIQLAFPEEVDGKKLDPTTPITAIFLDNIKTTAAVNLNQGTVAPATGATAQTMRPLYLGYTEPTPADGRAIDSLFYQAIVVPQTIAAGTKQLVRMEVRYTDGTVGLCVMPIDADLTFESGTMHTLSLSFDTQKRLRLEASKKVAWDKNTDYNTSSNLWQGDNQTITIGATTWAKGYLVAEGSSGHTCKVGGVLDNGLLFQFGSLVGWDNTKSVKVRPSSVATPAWGSNYYNQSTSGELFNLLAADNPSGNGTGDACRFYLGSSWRLPTAAELFSLTGKSANGSYLYSAGTGSFDNTSFAGKLGAWWGANHASRDSITVPYMLHSGSFSAAQGYTNATSLVWSSTLGGATTTAQTLAFDNSNFAIATGDTRTKGGLIRCVWIRKIYEFTNPAMSGTTPVSLRFGFNFACTWAITGTPAWLTLSATSGKATIGEATIALTMTPTDAATATRTATLTVTGTDSATGTVVTQSIVVTQNP